MFLKNAFCVFFLVFGVCGDSCFDTEYSPIESEEIWTPKLNRNVFYANESWQPKVSQSFEGFYVVDRIPLIFLSRFRRNSDIALLFYSIPQDTEEFILTLVAGEQKINSVGGECPASDVEVHLKPRSFPLVNPTNSTRPAGFPGGRDQRMVLLRSDEKATHVHQGSPEPGAWYGTTFVSWTDPKQDAIEQQGLAIECRTLLYADVQVKKAVTSAVDCNKLMKIILRNPATSSNYITRDIYKCFLDDAEMEHSMQMTLVSECTGCLWAVVRIQAKSLPREGDSDNIINCAIDLADELDFKFSINHFPNEWHYLSFKYGDLENITQEAVMLKPCKTVFKLQKSSKIEEITTTELIREKKTGYFYIGYNIPSTPDAVKPSSLNVVSGTTLLLKLNVFQVVDIGGTLTLKLQLKESENVENSRKLVVCVSQGKKMIPVQTGSCEFNGILTNASVALISDDVNTLNDTIHFPYPESGTWYISFGIFCSAESIDHAGNSGNVSNAETSMLGSPKLSEDSGGCNATVGVSIASASCIQGSCGKYGDCNAFVFNGFLMSCCICKGGYSGIDCSDGLNAPPPSETLSAILLLTISNVLFIPSIWFALRRGYYPEALVYTSTMFFSTFYHACDASDNIHYGLCIVRMGVLQFCDFFCGLLSFWVTLVAMASLDQRIVSVLHIFGVVIIAFGTELDKLSILVFLIPILIAVTIVFLAWGFRCRKTRALFPVKIYWLVFLPAGLVLVGVGLLCFTLLQTNDNYYIVHSIWHMTIALSIVCLLPTKMYFFPKTDAEKGFESVEDMFYVVDENFNNI